LYILLRVSLKIIQSIEIKTVMTHIPTYDIRCCRSVNGGYLYVCHAHYDIAMMKCFVNQSMTVTFLKFKVTDINDQFIATFTYFQPTYLIIDAPMFKSMQHNVS
jgi:hypothetical protein